MKPTYLYIYSVQDPMYIHGNNILHQIYKKYTQVNNKSTFLIQVLKQNQCSYPKQVFVDTGTNF